MASDAGVICWRCLHYKLYSINYSISDLNLNQQKRHKLLMARALDCVLFFSLGLHQIGVVCVSMCVCVCVCVCVGEWLYHCSLTSSSTHFHARSVLLHVK